MHSVAPLYYDDMHPFIDSPFSRDIISSDEEHHYHLVVTRLLSNIMVLELIGRRARESVLLLLL